MAEIRSAVYLVALDPATGEVRWQQQLVGLEQGIALDPARRLRRRDAVVRRRAFWSARRRPARSIAIDVVKREFAWVYRYPREPQSPAEMRNMWQQQCRTQAARANDRWLRQHGDHRRRTRVSDAARIGRVALPRPATPAN